MQTKFRIFCLLVGCLAYSSCLTPVASIPDSRGSLKKAEEYARQSDLLYQKAVQELKGALKTAQNSDEIHIQLGELFFRHADYRKTIEQFSLVDQPIAKKLCAMAYYKLGEFTDALSLFNQLGPLADDEYLYDYGRTCEEQNLFDQALDIYAAVQQAEFKDMAQARIQLISAERQNKGLEDLDPFVQDLIRNAPSQEDNPQAAAVILFDHEGVTVQKNNTVEYVHHYLLKILNERGKKYGEIQTGYDSTYDKVTVEIARTIRPDGTVISVGSKHTRDVSRYLNFPLYSNARVRIVSMPEVSVGTFIEYKVRISTSRMIADEHFRAQYLLQPGDPVLRAKFVVSLPVEKKLKQKILNREYNPSGITLEPNVADDGNQTTYTWEFENIPLMIPEPSMPPRVEITPNILLSTFESWDEIYNWWWALAKDKMETNREMKDKIRELINGKETLLDQIKAIYHFCAKEIRYVAVEYGQAGFEPHQASEIFENKYGDCKDQSILLISMLKGIGVPAYPVLIPTRGTTALMDDFPMVLFNHAIVAIKWDHVWVFLDPTGETVSFGDLPQGDQGRRVMIFREDGWELATIPRFPAEHNQTRRKTVLQFDNDENITAERTVWTKGVFDQSQRRRFRYTMPILIEESLKTAIQNIIPASTLIDYTIENVEDMNKEIVLSYHFRGSDYLIKAGNDMRVVPFWGGINLNLAAKDARVYPIDLTMLTDEESTMELRLPPTYSLLSLPEAVIRETPWFRFEGTYTFENNVVRYSEKTLDKTVRIEIEDYAGYKSALEQLSKDIRQSVILRRKTKDHAP
ncbi:MAG: DUF3857 domain-containing protein [Candidatus Omnitrophota bacterium]